MSAVIIFLSIFFAAAFLLLSLYARRAYKRRRHVQKLYQEVIKAVNSRRESSGNEIDPALMRNIRQILDNSPSVLKADFSLTTLARETGSNTTYVSNAINSGFGQSFSTLVAKRRMPQKRGKSCAYFSILRIHTCFSDTIFGKVPCFITFAYAIHYMNKLL